MSGKKAANHKENCASGRAAPGPEPDRLKIEGDWEGAIGKAMKKDRPKDGWPKADPDEQADTDPKQDQ